MNIPGVYALSAANAHESSYGVYCANQAVVNGKNIGSCLADLFSASWMDDSDSKDTTQETLTEQFQVVKQKTDLSHVMQWGDLSFGSDKVSDFEGGGATRAVLPEPSEKLSASAVPVRQIDLHNLFWQYTSASNAEERIAHGKEMQQEL